VKAEAKTKLMIRIPVILLFAICFSASAAAQTADELVLRGQNALRGMDVQSAMQAFDQALKLDAKNAKAAFERGRIFLKMGEHKLAVADFTTTILADPKHGRAFARRGEAYVALKNPDAAFADFASGIAAEPDIAELRVIRAIQRLKIGNLVGAREDVDAALKIAKPEERAALEAILLRIK
jgi:tetratricopeptide (TPR) repeat protein